MKYDIITTDGFAVVGDSCLTSNAANEFRRIWENFLCNYRGGAIVGVYSDYESDFRGKFRFTVGIVAEPAAGSVRVAGGKYARFIVRERTEVADVWQYVWQGGLDRAYTADYEKYDADGSVEIYVSLR